MAEVVKFISITVDQDAPGWCVDGRPDFNTTKGLQMLGGSLHPVLLSLISKGIDLTADTVHERLAHLVSKGYSLGAHRGSHGHAEKGTSDCGFADKMPSIIQTAIQYKDEIISRLQEIYEEYKGVIGSLQVPFKNCNLTLHFSNLFLHLNFPSHLFFVHSS